MKIRPWVFTLALSSILILSATGYRLSIASDHDDGETDVKSRALNLTDHYMWKDLNDGTLMNFAQTSNPRSLPGFQYYFSTQARYDIHVSRVTNKTAVPTGSDDLVFRFTFKEKDANNVQEITLTVIKDGATVGASTGSTTPIRGTATINSVTLGGSQFKFFAGLREDTFTFDVGRFFEVRDFLATTFFGGGNAVTALRDFQTNHKSCDGYKFLENFGLPYDTAGAGGTASTSNGDKVHLFNPPECAEDFTKLYNRNEIELQMPITALQSGAAETVFDSWSTISIPQ